jgi:putative Mg2+ transporter-C (MgtC) family protein
MSSLTIADFAMRIGVGVGCGALIGLERQWRAKMAGLRTNVLVAAGATLFVLYAVAVDDATSPTRVASYVVSGVGFLGGGVILRDGLGVRGLNTAATMWCSAAVGVLAAAGLPVFALIGTAAVIATHLLGRPLGRFIDRDHASEPDEDLHPHELDLICSPDSEQQVRANIVAHTGGHDLILCGIHAESAGGDIALTASLLVDGDAPVRLEHLVAQLSQLSAVRAVRWQSSRELQPGPTSEMHGSRQHKGWLIDPSSDDRPTHEPWGDAAARRQPLAPWRSRRRRTRRRHAACRRAEPRRAGPASACPGDGSRWPPFRRSRLPACRRRGSDRSARAKCAGESARPASRRPPRPLAERLAAPV